MFQKKLLMLLYKKIFLTLIIILSSCVGLLYYPQNITNLFYINNINEQYGMLLKHKIHNVFKNKDINTAKYIVTITLLNSDSLSLTNIQGFSTRGTIYITAKLVITNKQTGEVLANITNSFNEIYNIESNAFATTINKQKATEYLMDSIATNSIIQINLFIKRNYNNII